MRRFPLLLVALALCLSAGCDLSSDESGTVTLTGQVLDALTNNPIEGAFVRVLPSQNLDTTDEILAETDEQGRYEIKVEIDATTDLRIVASEDAYAQAETTVLAVAGRTVEVPNFRLRRIVEEEPESGTPSNILLIGQSEEVIGVLESGSVEVSRITFQVADSAGRPVTLDDQALVRFRLGQRPNGGEFIAPAQAPTDNNGLVTVNLSSGTVAGAVQVIAEFDAPDGSRVVRSKPVNVTIHGGLPDQSHFSLGPAQFNFPGLLRFGLTNRVSVVVGDKYANPVKPGTAVYFTSSHGVIEGSLTTDQQGRGAVDLLSGNPLPDDGVAIVTAETADENENRVTGRFPVLFSGFIVLRVEPTVARLGETYSLTLTDQNGNPLAPGTALTVRAQGTKVKAVGNTAVTLDDTIFTGFTAADIIRGPGITEFTFKAVEDLNIDETGVPTLETITIRVAGPNGAIEVVLTGGEATPRVVDGQAVLQADGSVLIQANH